MQTRCPQCQGEIVRGGDQSPDGLHCAQCGFMFTESLQTVPFMPDGPEYQATVVPDQLRKTAERLPTLPDYEVVEEIARGGMGVVFKAHQKSLNRTVALKLIRSGELADPAEVARFRAEAEAAARLEHQGIVPVYEVGEHRGQHFLSMAFIDGGSLSNQLENGPLEPRRAAEIMRAVAEAVQFAHDRGIIHRDLKPQNILLDADGRPRVSDFGLAKNVRAETDLTATGQVLGTPAYMSPEQALGAPAGRPADVYSLGATLYCLLTGHPPFKAATQIELLRKVVEDEPVSPRELNTTIPADLQRICLVCLRKEKSHRYESAAALGRDLNRWLNEEPIQGRVLSSSDRFHLWRRRHPVVFCMMAGTIFFTIESWLHSIARRREQGDFEPPLTDELLFVFFVLWVVPTVVAYWRRNRSAQYILALNFFCGCTTFVWSPLLYWALTGPTKND